ncbi:NAC domain-containing protein 22-like [Rhodamnia argentea]|uniref:NAC domain-containing protein 22-like n=1 Tax=Rhodamnia argentea TaxID=178133 RepID=A0A8B8QUR3_9MYRT|nr:NAC domain-containing protein 22-like [Rhodamnia argentea]
MNSQAPSSLKLAANVASSSVPPQDSHSVVAPGFRFRPTEQELILYYLGRKVLGLPLYTNVVPDIDIYKFEPHEVPEKVGGDLEWYFFSKLDKKYETGVRVNRSTKRGYWKVTGPEHKIKYGTQVIGQKRFLVYYAGQTKVGRRTDWVMHEYRLMDATLQVPQARDVYVVSRLFWKGNSEEEGDQVHDDTVAPADVALQPLAELGSDEMAPAAYARVIRKRSPRKTLDLLTNFDGEGRYENLEETSSAREDAPTHPVKRPRNAEANGPQNLSPGDQEPNSSNSVAGAVPSLTLSLACPASKTAPEQQEQRQIAMPEPVPQQAVEPPWRTTVQTSPNSTRATAAEQRGQRRIAIPQPVPQQAVEPQQTTAVQTWPEIRLTIERETVKRQTSEDQCVKDV